MNHSHDASVPPVERSATPAAVVFDMDGLMFNTEEIYTLAGDALLRRRGKRFTADVKRAMMGLPPRRAFEVMIELCHLAETPEQLIPESNAIFTALLPGRLAPMPGLLDLLDRLDAAGIPKAIATSSGRELTTACLGPFDLERRFRFVLTSEDIVHGKPHPEVYLKAAQRLGVAPATMAVLEDSENGCRAAAAAGAVVIAVPGEHSRQHDFSPAALVVESLRDPRLYARLGLGRTAGGS